MPGSRRRGPREARHLPYRSLALAAARSLHPGRFSISAETRWLGWPDGLQARKSTEEVSPAKPGVYLFRDRAGDVLYVGKAKSLRPRVRSYFQQSQDSRTAIQQLAGPGRGHRGDRDAERGRGAAPRAEPRQAAPAAVQRPPARRQVVSVHRRHRRGRVPARHVHARAPPPRRRVLRAVRQREEGARDARRPQPGLPVPALRGAEARASLGDPVPRLPHRAVPRAVRGLRRRRRITWRSSTR